MKVLSAGLILLACGLMSACSTGPVPKGPDESYPQDVLYQEYQKWRGVPYRLGGNSRAGVDCSALVQLTYLNAFSRNLPRTTDDQARLGAEVRAGEERSGDLVFFRTGLWSKHVGIYLGDGRFMHASASNGVMISSLSEPYWQTRYWKSKRP